MVLDYDKDVNSQDNEQHLFRQLSYPYTCIYKIVQNRSWLFCYEPRFYRRHVNRVYRVYWVCKIRYEKVWFTDSRYVFKADLADISNSRLCKEGGVRFLGQVFRL